MDTEIGQMSRVGLRNVWENEATDFTPWLAEHIHILGEQLGMHLEVQSQEQWVGVFRADLVALDTLSNSLVIIENQIEKTDHSHLGQLITYAAGLHASTIVWIARLFTGEHRAALDWLNEISFHAGAATRFFGLEVELWRIGDSRLACKFNIVAAPSIWKHSLGAVARRVSTVTKEGVLRMLEEDASLLDLSGSILAQRLGTSKASANRAKSMYITLHPESAQNVGCLEPENATETEEVANF